MTEKNLWTAWPTNTEGVETRSVLTGEYRDHGNWARHYSTVRLTLGTFFLGAATSVIYLRWDSRETSSAVLADAILLIGAFLFLWFSWLTLREMNHQRRLVKAYRKALGGERLPQPLGFFKSDAPYLCLLSLVLFGTFEWWWLCEKANSGRNAEVKVPLTVQVGGSPPVQVEIPVKVTLP